MQQQRSSSWQAEYSIDYSLVMYGVELSVFGRIDLLEEKNRPIAIEEIKTCMDSIDLIPESRKSLHLAQVKVYAALYFLNQKKIGAMEDEDWFKLCVSYLDLRTNSTHVVASLYSAFSVARYFYRIVGSYCSWIAKIENRNRTLKISAQRLRFPYPVYRPGQYDMARSIYQVIRDKRTIMIEAPTGIGKTMSSVFPAIKALGESHVQQILYLTAKRSAQRSALNTVDELNEQKLCLDYLVIQAKERACVCLSDDPLLAASCKSKFGKCSRTVGFYDRLHAARIDCLAEAHLNVEVLNRIADKHHLCPFALSMHWARWSTFVICDLNYFFDPLARLTQFENNPSSRVLLIDELHNFPERAKSMYSAALSLRQTISIYSQLGSAFEALKRPIKKLMASLDSIASSSKCLERFPDHIVTIVEETIGLLNQIQEGALVKGLGENRPNGYENWVKSLYRILVTVNLFDESHCVLYTVEDEKKEKTLKIVCLDASKFLVNCYRNSRSLIGFSATLMPLKFFKQVLGLPEGDKALRISPAFPRENQLILQPDYIDTRVQRRDESVESIAELIETVFLVKPGKYLVFLPSYRYLNKVIQTFQQLNPDINVCFQQENSNDQQRADFLHHFFNANEPIIGFAISGGVFGEGLDFKGDALHGVIVVGTGMPPPGREQELTAAYYEALGLNGFDYAFVIPGWIKTLQSAGRVIRSETDRGVIVLVDKRYTRQTYHCLMPANWNVKKCNSIENIAGLLKEFW